MENKFYIIEVNYTGPNPDQHIDDDTIRISTEPARYNMSHEICLAGWAGTTNDWAVYAHGEYDTVEAARDAITEIFGAVREFTEFDDPDIIEGYKPGKYALINSQDSFDWAYNGIVSNISADTTDEEISALLTDYEMVANNEGFTLAGDLEDRMRDYRDELKEESRV